MKSLKHICRVKLFSFLTLYIMLLSSINGYAKDKIIIPKKTLEEYKIFSLGQCINGNYERMGGGFR